MSEVTNQSLAETTFKTLCQTFQKNKWWHEIRENKLQLVGRCRSGEQQIDITYEVMPDGKLVCLASLMPFQVDVDKQLEMAIAVNAVNNKLMDGYFEYNIPAGKVSFRMACSFMESTLGQGAFEYMMFHAGRTIAKYGKLLRQFCDEVCTLDFLRGLLSSGKETNTMEATEDQKAQAKVVFRQLCDVVITGGNLKFRDEEHLLAYIEKETAGNSVNYYFMVNPARENVMVFASVPHKMRQSMRMEGAVAACTASYGQFMGNFQYDMDDGRFTYRAVSSFRESQLGPSLYLYLYMRVEAMIKRYSQQFMAIDQGTMSIEELVEKEFA